MDKEVIVVGEIVPNKIIRLLDKITSEKKVETVFEIIPLEHLPDLDKFQKHQNWISGKIRKDFAVKEKFLGRRR